MKNSVILFVTLIIIVLESNGQTNVSGLISTNTTWTISGNPYIVVGNIAVDQGKTLTIEPGVQLKFDGQYYIYVDGTLDAQGTINDSIMFTSNNISPQEADWVGIKFRSTSTNSVIKYSHIEFAQNAIAIDGSSPNISNSLICNNTNGFYIYWNTGYPIISNNIISYNSSAGISGGSYVGTDIIGNEISYNNYGIKTSAWKYKINNNNINNNNEGIYFDLGGGGSIMEMSGNTISHNTVKGIYFKGYPIIISTPFSNNNIIFNGIGIYCKDFQGTISNNEISGNEIGIWNALGSYSANLSIDNNCFNNSELNFKQLRTEDITCTHNWWGTTDSLDIVTLIHDFYDDFDLGKVLISPILNTSNCNIVTNISQFTESYEKFQIKLYPNPSDGKFTITCTNNNINSIEIYNLHGEVVYTIPHCNLLTSNEINISDLPKGFYIVRIYEKEKSFTEKILIQ